MNAYQYKKVFKQKRLILLLPVLLLILVTGCTGKTAAAGQGGIGAPVPEVPQSTEESQQAEVQEPVAPVVSEDQLRTNQVNEGGEIMVIMYHRIADKNTAYDRTAQDFTKDLERLHQEGYVPITMWDYLRGHIDVPLGKTPYVLTFDDGSLSQFKINGIDADGQPEIDPECAIGLMNAFMDRHPEIKMAASFYLNDGVYFEQKEYQDAKIKYLLAEGYELGNHSAGHENFSKISKAAIESSLSVNVAHLTAAVAKADVPTSLNGQHGIYCLALPFGSRPKNPEDMPILATGAGYAHTGVLNVGWKPGVSPFSPEFDRMRLHRVQCGDGEMQLTYWLDNYVKHPQKRYCSDGDPLCVTIPEDIQEKIQVPGIFESALTLRTYSR